MSNPVNDASAAIKEQIDAIVSKGDDIRKMVAKTVADATSNQLNKQGMLNLSQSVLDGATSALDKAVPRDPSNVLRQVIDGLGDGLSSASLATRLVVEEAKGRHETFAQEDLSQMKTNLQSVGNLFVDTIFQGASKLKSLTQADASALRTHAEQVLKRVRPSLESTLSTIASHPLQFGKESIVAGVNLSVQALGSLFSAIGRRIEEGGKRMAGDEAGK